MSRLTRIVKEVRKELVFKRVPSVNIPEVPKNESFAGHLALVTGGGSGIGFSIGLRLAKCGCMVVLAGRNRQKIDKAVAEIGLENCRGIQLDVTDVDNIDSAIEQAVKLFPAARGVDILVNSAGVSKYDKFGKVSEESYDAVLDTNLKGTFFMSQAVANHMIDNGLAGHILNISSASALRPAKGVYEISKWGIKGMTLGFASELARFGIIVNALGPGPTATGFLGKDELSDLAHVQSPIGRMAHPEEIADLALMLLGPSGDLVVGDTLYATGGAGTVCIDR